MDVLPWPNSNSVITRPKVTFDLVLLAGVLSPSGAFVLCICTV